MCTYFSFMFYRGLNSSPLGGRVTVKPFVLVALTHLYLLQSHDLPVQQAGGLVNLTELSSANLLLNLEVRQ